MTHRDNRHHTGTSQQTGDTTRPMWGQHAQKYHSDWQSRFPNKEWGQHEHAFRYGWEGSFSDSFKGRDFNSATGDMEREWPNRYNYWPDFAGNKVERRTACISVAAEPQSRDGTEPFGQRRRGRGKQKRRGTLGRRREPMSEKPTGQDLLAQRRRRL